MKKITLMLSVVALFIGGLQAQITTYPYTEDFENGPASWTTGGVNNSWQLGTPANTIINSAASGDSSWVTNLTGNYNPSENSWVQSPVFDFSALNSPSIQARVWWNAEFSWDGMVLQSSIDGGTTWQNVGANGDPNNWYTDNTINGNPGGQQEGWTGENASGDGSGGWVTASHALTGLNNQASVTLRFAFGSDVGGAPAEGVGFDFVEVFEVTCPQPLALTTTSIGADSVLLGWTEAGTATTWDIEWGPTGFTLGTGAQITGTTDNPFNLNGLSPTTTYDFYVRASCGSGDSSVYTGPASFTTIASCPQPLALTATSIGGDSAIIGWTDGGSATVWDIEWGPAGFTPGSGTLISATSTNPFNLNGLSPTTAYDFYVRAICGPADSSLFSGPANFTTIASCPQPLALTATSIGGDSAIIGWTDGGSATVWDIEWGPAGFTPGSGTLISATSTNPFNLTGLTSNTFYDVYIRAICGPADSSLFSGPLNFTTTCPAFFLAPYQDDVEAHLPLQGFANSSCWTATAAGGFDWNIDNNGSTPSTGTGPLGAFSGTNYFYTEATGAATGDLAVLISPNVDITPLTAPNLEFRYHMFDDGTGDMGDLFIDAFDGTSWITLDSIIGQQQSAQADPWLKRFVSLSAFSGVIQVRFRGFRGTNFRSDICLDDINIIEAPTCPQPSALNIANLLANSVDLGWTENGSATSWEIEWGGAGFTQGTGALISGVTNPHPLTGLIGNTSYQFYVRAICGPGDTSLWTGPFSFLTPCAALPAPWFDDVEVNVPTTTLGFSNCWNAIPSTGFNYDWNIDGFGSTPTGNTGPLNAFSGTNYFYVENQGTVGDSALLLSPLVNLAALTTPTLEFRYHMFGLTTGDLFIDVSAAGGPWIPLDTISGQQQTAQADPWLKRFVDLSAYTGDVQIRFRAVNTGNFTGDISIDDIGINEAASCPEPSLLNVLNLLASSVDLAWTENGSATVWDIEWGGAGFTQGTGALISNTTTNPQALTGLIENTSYDFYVRSDCGAGDSSVWVGPITFLTPCNSFLAPWIDSVELHTPTTTLGFSECWNANPSTGFNYDWNVEGSGSTPSFGTGPTGAFSGTNYFYVETQGAIGSVAELVSPNITLTALSSPVLEFYYHMFGVNMGDLYVDISDGVTWTTIDSIIGQQQTATTDPWLKRFLSLSAFTGTIQIRFRAIHQGFTTGDISIDDISVIEAPNCPEPSLLTTINLAADSANLSWTENGTATNWEIEWGPAGFTQGSGTIINTSSNPFSLTGLTANTSYSYFVRAICGPGDTSLQAGPFTFLTPCTTEMAPYMDDVETHASNTALTFSQCWTASSTSGFDWNVTATGTTGSGGTGALSAFSGTNYFYTEASGAGFGDVALLNSPNIDVTPLNIPSLEFRYHMHGGQMGTLFTDVWDGAAWIVVDSIVDEQQPIQADPWLKRFISLAAFSGTIQVRFRAVSNGGFEGDICVDNINVIETPTCPEPSLITVTGVGTDSAIIDWVENGSATEWQIEWGPAGFTPGTGTFVTATSQPFILNGLSPATSYQAYVRAVCAAGDSSLFSGAVNFATLCAPLAAPWIDSVEAHAVNTNLDSSICWTATSTSGYDWNITANGTTGSLNTGATAAFSGTNYFYTEASGAGVGDTATLISPQIDLTGIVPTLEFRYHMFGNQMGTLFTDVWNGSTWVTVDTLIDAQQLAQADSFFLRSIELAAFSGIIQVRFRAVSNGGFEGDICLDDIEIKQSLLTTCVAPSALNATNITENSADLNWTDNAGAFVWQVEWGIDGFTPGTGTIVPTGTNPLNISGLTPGATYCFYVTTICGFGDSSIAIGPNCFTTPCFNVNLGSDTMPPCSGPLTLDAGITGPNVVYSWSNSATTQTITVDTATIDTIATTISVTATDTVTGCTSTDTIVVDFDCITGIVENGGNINLSIFPNPSKGIFAITVDAAEANELEIEVTNLRGQVVFSKSDFNNVNKVNQTINLEDNAKGIYFVNVTSDKGTVTSKIVVQ